MSDLAAEIAVKKALEKRHECNSRVCVKCKGTGTVVRKCPDCGGSCLSQSAQDEEFDKAAEFSHDTGSFVIRRTK